MKTLLVKVFRVKTSEILQTDDEYYIQNKYFKPYLDEMSVNWIFEGYTTEVLQEPSFDTNETVVRISLEGEPRWGKGNCDHYLQR